jgi:hypothetical protein
MVEFLQPFQPGNRRVKEEEEITLAAQEGAMVRHLH